MRILKHLPNFITCLNLSAGVIGIIYCKENLQIAAIAIFVAGIFDFFDGFVARWLNASSPIGKELDSLADMISFGLLPGLIVFNLLASYPQGEAQYIKFFALLIPVFSALRLAKFNIDSRQSFGFIGVPTPANSFLFAGFAFIFTNGLTEQWEFILIAALSIIMSLLMVSELPLFALKFKSFAVKDNLHTYLFLLVSLILFILLQFSALPLIILIYILISVVVLFLKKK